MYKEMVISIILVILIIIGDSVTQNYTKNTVNSLTDTLENLKQSIDAKSEENIEKEVNDFDAKWKDVHDKLAYYIEHDELEKVETNFVACKSLALSNEYEQALSELEKTKFVLDHITDKYMFNLVNIF